MSLGALASSSGALAQAANAPSSLPAINVEAPTKPQAKLIPAQARAKVAATRTVKARSRKPIAHVASNRAPVSGPASVTPPTDPQSPAGPGVGFSATRTTTATKTDTPIQTTPQSISVVTRDQIRDTGAQTVGEAIGYSAGVQTMPFGFDARYDQFIVRGFTTDTVGLYRDGLREANAPFARFRNDPDDLDRIEILRGPSSVLYGGANPGGLVNLVSKTPVQDTFGSATVGFGSYNDKQTSFDVNTPIGTGGNVWFRMTGLLRDSNTQVRETPNNRVNISPSLMFTFDGDTTLTLLGNYAGNRNAMWPYYIHTAQNLTYDVRASDPNYDNLNQNQSYFGYKFEHRFNDVFTFHQNFRTGQVGFDGRFTDQAAEVVPGVAIVPRYAGMIQDQLNTTAIDSNLQAKFSTGPLEHTLIGGIDYFKQGYRESFQLGGGAPSIDLSNPIVGLSGYSGGPVTFAPFFSQQTYQKLDQLGFYGQEQIAFGRLHINLGAREDRATMTTSNILANTNVSAEDHAFTGRAGALYLFDNGVAPYVSYSTSFLPTAGTGFGGTPFKPTTGEQIEGGVKYAPVGWNSTFTASYFDIAQNNVLTADPAHANFSIQTGQVTSRGLELEAVIGLAPGLNGIASYSNTDAINSESTTGSLGKVPVGVPRNQAAFFVDYTIQTGRFKGLGAGLGTRFIGKTWADAGNTLRNDAITPVDLQAHYDTGRFRLQVSARNIADQRIAVCNTDNCTFSQGRVVLGTLTARW